MSGRKAEKTDSDSDEDSYEAWSNPDAADPRFDNEKQKDRFFEKKENKIFKKETLESREDIHKFCESPKYKLIRAAGTGAAVAYCLAPAAGDAIGDAVNYVWGGGGALAASCVDAFCLAVAAASPTLPTKYQWDVNKREANRIFQEQKRRAITDFLEKDRAVRRAKRIKKRKEERVESGNRNKAAKLLAKRLAKRTYRSGDYQGDLSSEAEERRQQMAESAESRGWK
jgi:hypothetical protein